MFIPDQDSFRTSPFVRCAHLLSAAIDVNSLTPSQTDSLAAKVAARDTECESWPELFRLKLFIADHYIKNLPNAAADNPAEARLRGFKHHGSEVFIRRPSLAPVISRFVKQVPNTSVMFGYKVCQPAYYAIIPVECLVPSHTDWMPNPEFFLPEAQPSDRNASYDHGSARNLAQEINPLRLFDARGVDRGWAFSGAPVVNIRGEVVQGNTRAAMLRIVFASLPDKAEYYTQCLREWWAWCLKYDLLKDAPQVPDGHVLVRVLCEMDGSDISDEKAIELGQCPESEDATEGGARLFNPDNVLRKIIADNKLKQFVDVALAASQDDDDDDYVDIDSTLSKNFEQANNWLCAHRYISAEEHAECIRRYEEYFHRVASLEELLKKMLFAGGPYDINYSFTRLPGPAQLALLSVIHRDLDMPQEKQLRPYFQKAIKVYNEIRDAGVFWDEDSSQYVEADKFDAVLLSVKDWAKRPCEADYGKNWNGENYSDFVLYLAAAFRTFTRERLEADFMRTYDLMTGKTEGNLFNRVTEQPMTLPEAVHEVTGVALPQCLPRLFDLSPNPQDDLAELADLHTQISDLIATRLDHREPLPLLIPTAQRVETFAASFSSSILPQIEDYSAADLRTILSALQAYASFRDSLAEHPEFFAK